MQEQIRSFILTTLAGMNYDVSQVTSETDLGPAGLDLESLALADLAVQVEEEFGIRFELDDMESTALMTIDEFSAEVAARIAKSSVGTAG